MSRRKVDRRGTRELLQLFPAKSGRVAQSAAAVEIAVLGLSGFGGVSPAGFRGWVCGCGGFWGGDGPEGGAGARSGRGGWGARWAMWRPDRSTRAGLSGVPERSSMLVVLGRFSPFRRKEKCIDAALLIFIIRVRPQAMLPSSRVWRSLATLLPSSVDFPERARASGRRRPATETKIVKRGSAGPGRRIEIRGRSHSRSDSCKEASLIWARRLGSL